MIKEARELRRRVEAKVVSLKSELEKLEVEKGELQKKYEEVERSERNKVVKVDGQGGKLGVLLGLAKTRVSELRNALDRLLDQRDDLQDRVELLEDILTKFKDEYNPNFNDEGVKAAVKSWEDYAAGRASEKKPDLSDSDIMELLREDGETSGVNWAEFESSDASDADVGMLVPAPLTAASPHGASANQPQFTIGMHTSHAPPATSSTTRSMPCAHGPSITASSPTIALPVASLVSSRPPEMPWMRPRTASLPRPRPWKSNSAT